MARLKVGVLISGRGSNLAALIEACRDKAYPAEIVTVVSNKAAAGLAFARAAVESGADLVVLPADGAPWAGVEPARWLDAWLTGGSRADIGRVLVGGEVRA